jgi:mannose-1-phosphate guanylyltransferase
MHAQPPKSWTVVLAAGAGRRLASLTGNVPKQFWRPGGTKSLLEETTARFASLAPLSRTAIVVDRTHRGHVANTLGCGDATVLFQPEDRGTAAGVLFALTPVLASHPEAIVMITPSDHGVVDGRRFRQGLRAAVRSVESNGQVVLFGVEPTEAREDYGWITPDLDSSPVERVQSVRTFIEKPGRDAARRLLASGAVWNTMVVVARASAMRALYVNTLPQLVHVFDAALRLSEADRARYFSAQYVQLQPFDFSRDVITPSRGLSVYTWPASIGWSDLGTPDRLAAWHQRVGGQAPSPERARPIHVPEAIAATH